MTTVPSHTEHSDATISFGSATSPQPVVSGSNAGVGWVTLPNIPGTTLIHGGDWEFDIWAQTSAQAANSGLVANVFKTGSVTAKTFLFSVTLATAFVGTGTPASESR